MMKRSIFCVIFAIALMVLGGFTAYASEIPAIEAELPYVVADGTTYWESSWNFGTGRHGVVNEGNPYTTIPCYAGINGYSYLDEDGNVLAHNYIEAENDIAIPPAPEGAVALWKHFKTSSYRNGWVDSKGVSLRTIETPKAPDVTPVEPKPSEQTPEEVVKDIGKAIQTKSTAIVIDYSGSMEDNQKEVIALLETLEFNDSTTIIVFGDTFQIVSHEDLQNKNFSVGSSTHMFQALNKAIELGVEQIIIISDLGTYDDVELITGDKLKSVTIYNPSCDDVRVDYFDGTDSYTIWWSECFVRENIMPIWKGVEIEQVKIK